MAIRTVTRINDTLAEFIVEDGATELTRVDYTPDVATLTARPMDVPFTRYQFRAFVEDIDRYLAVTERRLPVGITLGPFTHELAWSVTEAKLKLKLKFGPGPNVLAKWALATDLFTLEARPALSMPWRTLVRFASAYRDLLTTVGG